MSFVTARPAALARATGRADQVSALTATQFSAHAPIDQAAGVQAVAVHELFTATLRAGAGSYAATDAADTIAAS